MSTRGTALFVSSRLANGRERECRGADLAASLFAREGRAWTPGETGPRDAETESGRCGEPATRALAPDSVRGPRET